MATPAGQETAYFAYNHDTEYSANVIAASIRYRNLISISMSDVATSTPLGLADPELLTIDGQAAASIKEFTQESLLDW